MGRLGCRNFDDAGCHVVVRRLRGGFRKTSHDLLQGLLLESSAFLLESQQAPGPSQPSEARMGPGCPHQFLALSESQTIHAIVQTVHRSDRCNRPPCTGTHGAVCNSSWTTCELGHRSNRLYCNGIHPLLNLFPEQDRMSLARPDEVHLYQLSSMRRVVVQSQAHNSVLCTSRYLLWFSEHIRLR